MLSEKRRKWKLLQNWRTARKVRVSDAIDRTLKGVVVKIIGSLVEEAETTTELD